MSMLELIYQMGKLKLLPEELKLSIINLIASLVYNDGYYFIVIRSAFLNNIAEFYNLFVSDSITHLESDGEKEMMIMQKH